MSELGLDRLLDALIRPRRAFEALRATPTWAAAFVALVVMTAVNSGFLVERTDFVEVTREAATQSGREIDPQQIELVAGVQERFGALTSTLSVGVALFAVALVLWVATKMVGGEGSYRQLLAGTLHGLLPWFVAMLLSLPGILRQERFGFADYLGVGFFPATLPTSLAGLAPEGAAPALLTVLSSLDLFSLWSVVLLAVGLAAITRIPVFRAAATVTALWAVYVLGKVGWVLVGTA
ncbi:MAG: YIP1 family protein [Thermoanaerobaculia bacterium]